MKKLKFILPVMAFVFAIAVSFASAKFVETTDIVGEFIQKPGLCEPVTAGCSGDGPTCTIPGQIVYRISNETLTMCSDPLGHTPLP
ncbi:hypothetical protein ED312_06660 [Sinomicrobium pectinilyticum]|uniref:Secreted protein n=1 Tax=Sinomicrobium pectinilyticum TaxID=1084421 RepID=A0A3N0EQP9_SINP1|nr:DUF6520 family protein [Sinomicrobium pectinilyticum]RNL90101.1 hypothetical protein ED312_06660 [Sinomicrobium pectinilyticum]